MPLAYPSYHAYSVEKVHNILSNLDAYLPADHAIAVNGMSGELIGLPWWYTRKRPVIVVNNRWNTGAHFDGPVYVYGVDQHHEEPLPYTFVDDLIDSGGTLIRTMQAIKDMYGESKIMRVMTYQSRANTVVTRMIDEESLPAHTQYSYIGE